MSNKVEANRWRLVIDPPASGSWNMAVDDALPKSAQGDGYLPTLRLYSWNSPCLSLGHAQHIREVDQEALRYGLGSCQEANRRKGNPAY